MQYSYSFTIERDGEEIELTAKFDIYPYIPGVTHLLPEDCYPSEGGYAEIDSEFIYFQNTNKPWNGTLSEEEIKKAEESAYKYWFTWCVND
jgi:hypothetical protein